MREILTNQTAMHYCQYDITVDFNKLWTCDPSHADGIGGECDLQNHGQ